MWPPSQPRPPQAPPFGTVAASRARVEMGGARAVTLVGTVTGMQTNQDQDWGEENKAFSWSTKSSVIRINNILMRYQNIKIHAKNTQ